MILIRLPELLVLARDASQDIKLDILKSNLLDNNVDDNIERRGEKIEDSYMKFHDNDQVQATIDLLKEQNYLIGDNVIMKEELAGEGKL